MARVQFAKSITTKVTKENHEELIDSYGITAKLQFSEKWDPRHKTSAAKLKRASWILANPTRPGSPPPELLNRECTMARRI
jgi:hypothetical protein